MVKILISEAEGEAHKAIKNNSWTYSEDEEKFKITICERRFPSVTTRIQAPFNVIRRETLPYCI